MSSVYDSSAGVVTDKPQGYMGCWTDTNRKALTGFSVYAADMSVTSCRSICSTKQFALAGVEDTRCKSSLQLACQD